MLTGINMLHVPYRGAAPALTDLIAGQVHVMFDNMPSSIEHIRAGTLRPLAVTATTRVEALADVPPLSDFVPGFETSAWAGIGAPKNTPGEIIDRLNGEINAALADPTIKARIAELELRTDRRLERGDEPLFDPHRSRTRTRERGRILRVRLGRDAQAAAQRIVLAHGLDAGELRILSHRRHADEGDRLRALQAAARDLVGHAFLPGVVGGEHEVRAKELMRVAHQRPAHAVGEEGNARDARHRHHEGRREHTQLASAPVPGKHA